VSGDRTATDVVPEPVNSTGKTAEDLISIKSLAAKSRLMKQAPTPEKN